MSQQPSESHDATPGSVHPMLRWGWLLYTHVLSPVLHATQRTLTGSPGACRFQPTCSEYAALAVHMHGPRRGTRLALFRFLRCHPFARGGFDPVPGASAIYPRGGAAMTVASQETASHLP